MSKELVVSSTSHETRVAILDDDKLAEVYIERASDNAMVGSVCKGRVSRVLPGMQSAFVKVGLERDAFLYVSDIIDQTEEIESGALDDDDDLTVASAPPAPAAGAPRSEDTPEEADQESRPSGGGERRGRGRRSRRGRGGKSSRFPESKFADVDSIDESTSDAAEDTVGEAAAGKNSDTVGGDRDELSVLPGESLAKYGGESGDEAPEEVASEDAVERASDEDTAQPQEARAESARGGRRRRRRRGRRGGSRDREESSEAEEQSEATPAVETDSDVETEPELPAEESVETDSDDEAPEYSDDAAEESDEIEDGDDSEDDDDAETDSGGDESEKEESQQEERDSDPDEDEGAEDSESEDSDESEGNGADEASGDDEAFSDDEASGDDEAGEEEPQEKSDDEAEKSSVEAGVRGRGGSRSLKRGRRGRRRRGRNGDGDAAERSPSDQDRGSTPKPDTSAGPLISELLKPGQEIIVQIAKEPLGKKGARITSHIALPGRYLVYMPTVAHVGVSRKINSDAERARLRRVIRENSEGSPGGFIVRTAGQGKSDEELIADIRFLSDLWKGIQEKAEKRSAPALLHTDLDVVERILRDQLGQSYKTIWVDSEEEYERIVGFIGRFQPDLLDRVKLYTRSTPIFDEFKITQEIEKALRPKVWLKSGGYIVINQTEALVAIDVNTGKYVGKSDRLEDTIAKTNLEAVQEIVRQMRLRDLGGIIVVDFIDMDDKANRKKVTVALEKELRYDRAPSKALAFNDFGLVAITRKRVKQSLERALCTPCSHCQGSGLVKSPDSVIYEILNDARRLAPKRKSKRDVSIRCHPEVAKQLKSRDNAYLQELEEVLGANVIVRGDHSLFADNFDIN